MRAVSAALSFRSCSPAPGRPSLIRIAPEIAADAYPDLDIETDPGKVDELAERIRARCERGGQAAQGPGPDQLALFVEENFEGNRENYFDPPEQLPERSDRPEDRDPDQPVGALRSLAERLGLPLEA